MTKKEREISEGFANLTDINRAYFFAILRSLHFAQKYSKEKRSNLVKNATH